MTTSVNHPPHYGGEANPYEAIKVIEAWGLGFCLGNVVKYLSRAGKKGDALEDLRKARWYLDREIGALESSTCCAAQSTKDGIVFTHVYATGLSEYDDGWYETIFTAEQFNDVQEMHDMPCDGAIVFSGLHPYDGRKMLFKGYYADSRTQARDSDLAQDQITFTRQRVKRKDGSVMWEPTIYVQEDFEQVTESHCTNSELDERVFVCLHSTGAESILLGYYK